MEKFVFFNFMQSRPSQLFLNSYYYCPSSLESLSSTLRFSGTKTPTSPLFRALIRTYHRSTAADTTIVNMAKNDLIHNANLSSRRAEGAISLLPTYLTDARAVTKYCRSTAPDGALQLSVAENQMLEDLLVPAITEFSKSRTMFPADAIYYQPTHGRQSLRQAVVKYLEGLLSLDDNDASNVNLDPEGIVVGAGCNAVLENLCVSLAEPGNGVLIPTPYYAAFEFDLGSRAGLKVIPVPTMEYSRYGRSTHDSGTSSPPPEAYYPTRAALDAAKQKSIDEHDVDPRILLISHPHNPLGVCYPPHVIKDMIDWCRENKIHFISDEIYAGSIYRKDTANFSSALTVASSTSSDTELGLGLGPYVHLVYALSKDFGLSGLRVGVMYSENTQIRLPLQKLNDLCSVSSQTQILVEDMMTSKSSTTPSLPWTNEFLNENQRRIRQRCDTWQSCLNDLNIPHLLAVAGLFVWMDLSEFLPEEGSPDERERVLYLDLMEQYGLLLTPGRSMKNELPGFFRCVFTAASDHEFDLAIDRLKKFVGDKRS